ncbi:hypothetical protein DPEC_G00251600 [Dallia pectoralis]|uniref:Uncharacterized protein n=1 Tax=Dallia pectoralis TaxID=75939 RepID=A0ACC2FT62_DALPE|nr:hypothetical protein DPEC_G00251600 [Dallia pectoralis]
MDCQRFHPTRCQSAGKCLYAGSLSSDRNEYLALHANEDGHHPLPQLAPIGPLPDLRPRRATVPASARSFVVARSPLQGFLFLNDFHKHLATMQPERVWPALLFVMELVQEQGRTSDVLFW